MVYLERLRGTVEFISLGSALPSNRPGIAVRRLAATTALLAAAILSACSLAPGQSQGSDIQLDTTTVVQQGTAQPGQKYAKIASPELAVMLTKKDFVFVNVHIPYEGEIEKTDVFVPYNEIEKNLDKLPKDKAAKIVLYCMSGRMSAIAADTLSSLGYTNLLDLTGGMVAWRDAGYQVIKK